MVTHRRGRLRGCTVAVHILIYAGVSAAVAAAFMSTDDVISSRDAERLRYYVASEYIAPQLQCIPLSIHPPTGCQTYDNIMRTWAGAILAAIHIVVYNTVTSQFTEQLDVTVC